MRETTIAFTGDIGFDKYMDRKWEEERLLADEVSDFLKQADHLVVNVEGPLSDRSRTQNANGVASLQHSMNPAAAKFMERIGADVWNICNNHICDAGPEGIADTLAEAEKYGVRTLGAGMDLSQASAPVIFPEAGGIGMIGVGYQRACRKAGETTPGCFSWSDLPLIAERIAQIKKTCRWCIVVAHAGEEFTALPSPYTRERYLAYLDMGADLVIAHHPHVPMNYETFPGKAVFYSLGNFVFDTDYQRAQFNTEYGVLLKLRFTEESFSFEPMGIRIDRETERVLPHALPDIFTDVCEKEYKMLAPLAARLLVENTKRQLRFLKPEQFANATEEDWHNNFYEPLRSGRVPGECLDFQLICPLAQSAEKGEWKESRLEGVKGFILRQIP